MSRTNNVEDTQIPGCKGCTASVHITDEELTQLFGSTLRIREVKLTSDEEYTRRMAACKACEAFQFGTTCRWCGCLMAVKGKLAAARCPAPEGSRW
jgi:hypothetical protein